MFSVRQKREIAEAVQLILRSTKDPELSAFGEVKFCLHVFGANEEMIAKIQHNDSVPVPDVNPHNERSDPR